MAKLRDFNPLHREGGDVDERCGRYSYNISIHSTARVETGETLNVFQVWYFNPLHREGGDSKPFKSIALSAISIHSTARVETLVHHQL